MAIRLRLSLKRGDKEINTVAMVNSGYETLEPEILIPSRLAEELGLLPILPPGSMVKDYN